MQKPATQAIASHDASASKSSRTHGGVGARLIATFLFGAVVVGGIAVAWSGMSAGEATADVILHDVKRQDMEVVVVERGNLESAKNAELYCEVEARSPGSPATSIKWIVPEGHTAKKGELLCEFDSASLQDQVTAQKVKVEQAKASRASADADFEIVKSQNQSDIKAAETSVELAAIDLRKYLEGDYMKERRKIEGDILIAEEEVKRAKERLDYSERLNKKGYVSTSEVESDQLAVTRAENSLAMAREEMRVLNEYTKPRQTKDLESKRDEAKRALDRVMSQSKAKEAQSHAKQLAEQAAHETEEGNLRKLERQLGVCKLTAPIDGLVTYANEQGRMGMQSLQIEEGASVRERQKIIRIPDLASMQVNVKVHEAKVAHLAPGQPARIKVESMPDRPMRGTVKSVATMADAQSWMSSGVQVFTVLVSIDDKLDGLRPGTTAEVEILANKFPGALPVPVQAVIERKGKSYCYIKQGSTYQLAAVELGASNEKLVAILNGVKEGDKVVQNISTVLTDAQLRQLSDSVEAPAETKDAWAGRDVPKAASNGGSTVADAKAKSTPAAPAPGGGPARGAPGGTTGGVSGGATSGALGGPGGSPRGQAAGGAGNLLATYDKNGDGKIGKDEVGEATWLSRFDTNKDGDVDKGELAAVKRGGGGRGMGGSLPSSPAEYIKSLDKNNDGKVAKDEMPEQARQFFSFTDTNGDGFADRSEIEAMYKRMEQMRKSGGFGGGPGGPGGGGGPPQ